ncbi:unnamed protein product [Somion occarium]|uniref:NYN domain-containing protein n=1 Tax=Somion occarium TaxID=3059160 RepID=A0ABP1DAJ2_9APHY
MSPLVCSQVSLASTSALPTKTQGIVGIFWDYENCEVPSTSDGCAVAAAIIDLAERYGTIKVFKAYLETAQHATASPRSELASSGVDIIDCPHNGKKDVVDKMLMVDMMTFALDNAASDTTIIIISGDGDFMRAVASLRRRQYCMIVIAPRGCTHPGLSLQSAETYSWENDVLAQQKLSPLSPGCPEKSTTLDVAERESSRTAARATGQQDGSKSAHMRGTSEECRLQNVMMEKNGKASLPVELDADSPHVEMGSKKLAKNSTVDNPGSEMTKTEQESIPAHSAAPSNSKQHRKPPEGFEVLVKVLEAQRLQGNIRITSSLVGRLILEEDKDAYKRLGTSSLTAYTVEASKKGIVLLGKDDSGHGNSWIELHKDYHGPS